MDGDEGEAQFLVRDVRREELSLGSKNRFGWVKARDDFISGFHNWKDNPVCKDFEAFVWAPKIRVLNDGLIIFGTAETEKFQPGIARLGFKILTGYQHNAEATFYQVLSNPNKWIDIAGTANGAKEDRFFCRVHWNSLVINYPSAVSMVEPQYPTNNETKTLETGPNTLSPTD